MITLVVFHNVNDHDQWKVAFDAHEDVRRAHGAVEHRVYRHATERNRVVVHLYFQDADAARGFMADPSLPVAMEGAGVIGEPWLALFEQTETLSYTPGDAGVTLTVHHTVRDFATWKPVFDEHESVRRSHGALGHRIVRRLDDLNIVVVAIDFPSIEAAEAFGADPSLPAAMERGGVEGAPTTSMSSQGERKAY